MLRKRNTDSLKKAQKNFTFIKMLSIIHYLSYVTFVLMKNFVGKSVDLLLEIDTGEIFYEKMHNTE
jgi:hypothetical protein